MEHVEAVLSQLYKVLNCKIAIKHQGEVYFWPTEKHLNAASLDQLDYKRYVGNKPAEELELWIESSKNISGDSAKLAILFLETELSKQPSLNNSIIKQLEGRQSFSDVSLINKAFEGKSEVYLLLISNVDLEGYGNELKEVVQNSLDTLAQVEYQGDLVVLAEGQGMQDICDDLHKNLVTEIFIEPIIAIGGSLQQAQQLTERYNNAMEAMLIKKNYHLNQHILNYEAMMLYRLIDSIDDKLKLSIIDRIFTPKLVEFLNNEMELTIEEMFKTNLNLTDTSSRLYIHRNTLLYRIDKLYKLTGYDLRKFEDSMIFKLAWLMYKERKKQQ